MGRIKQIRIEDIVLLLIPLAFVLLFLVSPEKKEVKKPDVVKNDIGGPGISVNVYNPNDNVIFDSDLDEYLVGVVAAEMPPEFHMEALKAQAVAARTYALGRMKGYYGDTASHFGADICTSPGHCQAWISKERFLEVYGNIEDWEKIRKAVSDTRNIVITYGGTLINPLFHSNSGGITEDVQEVWAVSGSVPYLTSVYSPDESSYPDYEKKMLFSWDDIKKKVKSKYPKAKFGKDNDLKIESYDPSGRVETVRVGSVSVKGTEFRELLELRSSNFEFSFPAPGSVEIKTIGYGHGVGMSQCGADALAKEGYGYEDILKYYYTGVDVGEMAE